MADATTMGAGYLAGLAVGEWSHLDDIAASWRPAGRVEPASADSDAAAARAQWQSAVERAGGWIPDLSALDF